MAEMTYDQATAKAVQLHNQGMTYTKIEEYFKSVGYVSPRTKRPVGSLAIRHMVTQYEAREQKELKEEAYEEKHAPISVVSPVRDLLNAVEKILDIDGLAEGIKIKMVRSLLREEKQQDRQAAPKKRRGRAPKASTQLLASK